MSGGNMNRFAAIGLLGLAIGIASPLAAAPSPTRLVSVNRFGTASGDGSSGGCNNSIAQPSVSADGRLVAFLSCATDLVANKDSAVQDVLVRDLATGITTLVSADTEGTGGGNAVSWGPTINAGGCLVAFFSSATNLVTTADTNANTDVFVRDLATGATTLVSVATNGTSTGNGGSWRPTISADGRFVAFLSQATNLVATPTLANTSNVFVRDLQTQTTQLVSINGNGDAGGNADSNSPLISADGHLIAFESFASDLVSLPAGGAFGKYDVFVRDVTAGTTTLVSVNAAGTAAANDAETLDTFSPSGRFVGFEGHASDLVTLPTNGHNNVFVRDLESDTTQLVSANRFGTAGGAGDSFNSQVSDAGVVAFTSSAADLVVNRTDGLGNVFLRNLDGQSTTLLSVRRGASAGGNGASFAPEVTGDGRVVAFQSDATNLVYQGDGNHDTDLFVRDVARRKTALVTINRGGTSTSNAGSRAFTISQDGSIVAFDSLASNLVPNDTNGALDVFASLRSPQSGGSSSCEPLPVPTPAPGPTSTQGPGETPIPGVTQTPSDHPTSAPTAEPTPAPVALWRLYIPITRAAGSGVTVNVPLRSPESPVAIAIDPDLIGSFPVGVHKTSAQITALGGDTLAALRAGAEAYIESHPADYPGFTGVSGLTWAARAAP
jgi:hypothetical protein